MSVESTLSLEQQQLMEEHLQLVIEANRKTNLTRIDSFEEGMVLHVQDSLAGLSEIKEAPDGFLADMGSGAGFPGIPLSIATGRDMLLIDARKKKMDIVKEIISKLGLSDQIHTYAGRAELLARYRPCEFAGITVRALSQLEVLLELASPLLQDNGILVCYKAHVSDVELAHARRVQPMVGMSLVGDRGFMLNGEYQRRILTFAKTSKPQVKLPRQEGMAQKRPLSEQ